MNLKMTEETKETREIVEDKTIKNSFTTLMEHLYTDITRRDREKIRTEEAPKNGLLPNLDHRETATGTERLRATKDKDVEVRSPIAISRSQSTLSKRSPFALMIIMLRSTRTHLTWIERSRDTSKTTGDLSKLKRRSSWLKGEVLQNTMTKLLWSDLAEEMITIEYITNDE
jgi:hypothetical protein